MAEIPQDIENSILLEALQNRRFYPIENLVLEGGGVKGITYIGALAALEESGLYTGIKRVAGSSAGGIIAMLVGLGYSVEEMDEIVRNLNFLDLMDPHNPFWFNDKFKASEELITFLQSGNKRGVYRGEVFFELAKSYVARALPEFGQNATFGDLKRAIDLDMETKGYSRLKNMIFTGTNLSTGKTEYFGFDNPDCLDMPIALAVRITMSFPGAFEGVEWKGNFYVDGGVGNNLPIEIFDHKKYIPKGIKRNEMGNNPCTLGLKIDTADEIYGFDSEKSIGLIDYFSRLIGLHTRNMAKHAEKRSNIVRIFDEEISTLDFDLNEEKKQKLIESGNRAINDWISSLAHQTKAPIDIFDHLFSLSDKEIYLQYFFLKDRIHNIEPDASSVLSATQLLRQLEEIAIQKNINLYSEESRVKYSNYLSDRSYQKIAEKNQNHILDKLKMTQGQRLDLEWSVCQDKILVILDLQDKINETIEVELKCLDLHKNISHNIIGLLNTKPIDDMIFNFLKKYQEILVKLDEVENKLRIAKKRKDNLEPEYLEKINDLHDQKNAFHRNFNLALEEIETLIPESKTLLRDFISEMIRAKQRLLNTDPATNPLPINLQETKDYFEKSNNAIQDEIDTHKTYATKLREQKEDLQSMLTYIKHRDIRQNTYEQLLRLERESKKTVRDHFNLFCKMGSWLKNNTSLTYGVYNWLMRVTPGRNYENAMNTLKQSAELSNVKSQFQTNYQQANLEHIYEIRNRLKPVQENIKKLNHNQKLSGQLLKLFRHNIRSKLSSNKHSSLPKIATPPLSISRSYKKNK